MMPIQVLTKTKKTGIMVHRIKHDEYQECVRNEY